MNSAKTVLFFREGETLTERAWTCLRMICKNSSRSNDVLNRTGPEFEPKRFRSRTGSEAAVSGGLSCRFAKRFIGNSVFGFRKSEEGRP